MSVWSRTAGMRDTENSGRTETQRLDHEKRQGHQTRTVFFSHAFLRQQ